MYTLGIDTTFRLTSVAIVNQDNEVLYNKNIELNLSQIHADYFFNNHLNNILTLIKDIPNGIWSDINLISVVSQNGAFHSLPIGVTAACILGQMKNKDVVGVSHIIGHIYSNWINRKDEEFDFPILVLNISAGHNTIHFLRSHNQIESIYSILYTLSKDVLPGISLARSSRNRKKLKVES